MNGLESILFGNENRSLNTIVPKKQMADQSLQIVAPNKPFSAWSEQDHAHSNLFMQRITQAWKSNKFTTQYLIYGKIDTNVFNWEIVPYQKCQTCLGRMFQQLQVLWRAIIGGVTVSNKSHNQQVKNYQSLLEKAPKSILPSEISSLGKDSFCKQDTIERQRVMSGKKINVLFNYAPIGFGGERLHFLVVPKEHREAFPDVTQEEYCESMALTTKLVNHFTKTRKTIKNAYLLNKTGADAGQTVKHWHLHVIFSTNSAQDFSGKITVMKNILLGSTPMKKDDLAKRVSTLRKELAHL